MKRTFFAFLVLLAICLVIGACSKQAEVERPAAETPAMPAEEAPDTTVMDTIVTPDTTTADSIPADTTTPQ